jgi:2-oxoacid:acceptor oxidoreductase gamma subunit (pyruvate/2-ketoisovalerate family)/2-oxoacid:acceptor oxidoreductase delta subunit (pyruvate/2-ketoisovalerate family)
MYEIRFHGRGGQGAVMAAQALADAAVRIGYQAHAFPYFGAERRGAPVQAYARISKEKIRIKSQIYHPDLLVIMDESLGETDDLAAGLKPGGKVVVNTPKRPEELDLGAGVDAECATVDATAVALEVLKMPVVNTAVLGAFARIQDLVPLDAVVEAIEDRFGSKLGARAGVLNGQAARQAYDATVVGRTVGHRKYEKPKEWLPAWNEVPMGTSLSAVNFDGVDVGPGSSWQNLTGRWRWSTPKYKKEKCIKCLRCWWSCPDAAIIRLDDDFMKWDFNYCKGCGICADICPVDAIDMVQGVHEWP